MKKVVKIKDKKQKENISRNILDDLPNWFGIEKSKEDYVENSKNQTFFSFFDESIKEHLGFLTIKRHFKNSAEIAVMGVLSEYHRRGIGKELISAAEEWCQEEKVRFLQVKTLSDENTDQHYKKTRDFYTSMGFSKIEVFRNLWDEKNPCLLMIKHI